MTCPDKKYQPNDQAFPPQEEYSPVFIKYFEGYSCREIAAALHIPVQTVREKLRSSKRKLRINYKLFKRGFYSWMKRKSWSHPQKYFPSFTAFLKRQQRKSNLSGFTGWIILHYLFCFISFPIIDVLSPADQIFITENKNVKTFYKRHCSYYTINKLIH